MLKFQPKTQGRIRSILTVRGMFFNRNELFFFFWRKTRVNYLGIIVITNSFHSEQKKNNNSEGMFSLVLT